MNILISKQLAIKAVFFDIYGTIADFFPPKEEIQINVAEKFNITLDKDKILDAYKLANNFLVKQNSIFPIRKMNDEQKLNFFSEYEKIIIDNSGSNVDVGLAKNIWVEITKQKYDLKIFPDLIQCINDLRDMGLILGLISNINMSGKKIAEKLGVSSYFNYVFTSEDLGYEKPNKMIFEKSLDIAKLTPSEVVFIGDQVESDILGAKNANILPILLDRYNNYENYSEVIKINDLFQLQEIIKNLVGSK
ncbi:MAG: HAD family hydrolase [SAR202 cluster bacterium]|nr:HAD family hydrolase [SAR202 cluster bacterium]